MTIEQITIFAVLAGALVLFVWNRIRFDVVAMLALLVVAIAGLVPSDQLFAGFGHPAVVTVAAVLVISQGLVNAGVVDSIARLLGKVGKNPTVQVATMTGVVALCSGFINNVGALALLMPVAVWMAREAGRSPAFLLMPLAFGSLLGGTMTLIGTPPNIIIASYREVGSFGLLDFFPVGVAITLVEPRQKRSTFLKIASHRLGLEEVKVRRCRIEEVEADGSYDLVVSKAFEAPVKWLRRGQPYCGPAGAVVCMGRRSDEAALREQAQELGMELVGEAQGRGEGERRRVCYAWTPGEAS